MNRRPTTLSYPSIALFVSFWTLFLSVPLTSASNWTVRAQLGGSTFTEGAQRKFGISQAEAEGLVRGESAGHDLGPVLEQSCEALAVALERAQAYLRTAGEPGTVSRVMLCGGSALTPGLAEVTNQLVVLVEMIFNGRFTRPRHE